MFYLNMMTYLYTKGLVINYKEGGGLQNGKIAGPKLFAPPSRQGKTFCAPLLKRGNFLCPLSIWLKLQAIV